MLNHHLLTRWLVGYEAQRKRMLKRAPAGPLRDFLKVPFPAISTPFEQTPILAVDFETTGLDAIQDKLLSVGCVELNHCQIKLGTSYHQIIQTQGSLKADNVTIHQITDDQKDQGKPLADVVEHLLKRLAGKVMLVHFSRIERQFLQQACLELYGMAPPFPMIDTLVVAKKRLDKRDVAYDPSELRLTALRAKYGLPNHYAHNALNDAIATAELLLAQISERNEDMSLQQLIL
ncbi:exonuclease domain-containing protein [Cognaticolwellia beringensis]|uniref:DNA polymerase III subunit epsilon n=1 Tax=Cognaticolwellia beringensis TaxID=1967665 RepID=A0A222G6T5_9GAMM|nr:exonuclease domain-containing protein [Cognaticolwellia beringensis]ASP47607.1 DNA polymerase III subunit epsilon [Cognaticolwellia beringensis]